MDNFYEVGAFYAFEYEETVSKNPNFVWWECIEIKDGFAILYRMSKDHKGDPRPSTTPVELNFKSMIKRPYVKRMFLSPYDYVFESNIGGYSYMKFKILPDNLERNVMVVDLDENFFIKNVSFS